MRILCVCLGNICRSPTAEGVLRAKLSAAGMAGVEVESAGTGGWHVGHRPDERATDAAARRGILLEGEARRFEAADFQRFDLILAMDRANLEEMRRLAPDAEAEARLGLLREYDEAAVAAADLEVPDPYYGGADGFDRMLDLVERACDGLVAELSSRRR